MNSLKNSYIVKVGKKGEYRLNILYNIFRNSTLDFLNRAGVKEGMQILDMGCGIGTVSIDLANLVGPTGCVVGVDISPEQIAIAKRKTAEAKISNATFATSSIYDLSELEQTFDFIYCRFILMHLKDPSKALSALYHCLKPDGILACEEPQMSRCFATPPSEAFSRALQWHTACSKKLGVQFDLGEDLKQMMMDTGYKEMMEHEVQPHILTLPEKRIWALLTAESGDKYIEHAVATPEEISEVIAELEKHAVLPESRYGAAYLHQVWGKR